MGGDPALLGDSLPLDLPLGPWRGVEGGEGTGQGKGGLEGTRKAGALGHHQQKTKPHLADKMGHGPLHTCQAGARGASPPSLSARCQDVRVQLLTK